MISLLRTSLLISLVAIACNGFSQQPNNVVKFTIVDENGNPFPYTKVSETRYKTLTVTNQRGICYLTVPSQEANVRITFIGYESLDTVLYFKNKQADTIFFSYKMVPEIKELDLITVTTDPFQKVFETYNLNILDYTFFGQNILLLVKYKQDYQLRLLNLEEKLLIKQNLDFKPIVFTKDCLGILYIITDGIMYPVNFDSEQFTFPDSITVADYVEFIEPCVATTDDFFFLKYVTDFDQTIEYISQRKRDEFYQSLRRVYDPEKVLDLVEYDKKMVDLGNLSMGEINACLLRGTRDAYQNQVFFEQVLTQPTYAPLIRTKKAIYIFDHLADTCFVFNFNSEYTEKFPVNYHLSEEWANKLIIDEGTEKIYALSSNNGIYSLSEIDLKTGVLKNATSLEEHTYPEKIKIKNGYAYYLHHDMEKEGFNKLYKVLLKED